jgi:hypothetical protein
MQEFAHGVKVGLPVIIEDDSSAAYQWEGKITSVSDWFTHRRFPMQEPFQFNDVRTLECIVEVYEKSQEPPLRIGQNMRVMIKQGGP